MDSGSPFASATDQGQPDDRDARTQGVRDAATVLPFVTAILLAPPIILIFATPVTLFGVPLIVVYVFGVWLAVIGCACLVAGRLARADGPGSDKSR